MRYLFLLLLLPIFSLKAYQQQDLSSTFSVQPVPDWVTECDCSLEPIALKPSQVNLQFLLSDAQCNWPENSLFVRFAIKPLAIRELAM